MSDVISPEESAVEKQLNAAYDAFAQAQEWHNRYPTGGSERCPEIVEELSGDRFRLHIRPGSGPKARLVPVDAAVIAAPQLAIITEAVVGIAEEPQEKPATDARSVKYDTSLLLMGPMRGEFKAKRTDRNGKEYYFATSKPTVVAKATELMLRHLTRKASEYANLVLNLRL